MDMMEEIMDDLHNYRLEGAQADMFNDLKEAVADIDFDRCESILDEWIKIEE